MSQIAAVGKGLATFCGSAQEGSADNEGLASCFDRVTLTKLAPSPCVDLAVHFHLAALNHHFGLAAASYNSGVLEELVNANGWAVLSGHCKALYFTIVVRNFDTIESHWEELLMLAKSDVARRYLELLKKSLLNELYIENEARIVLVILNLINKRATGLADLRDVAQQRALLDALALTKETGGAIMLPVANADGTVSNKGARNFTELSHTMIGRPRLDNIQFCVETVLDEDVPGDMIETGIWRGGATIFMRGILAAYGITDRTIWAADSFEGVPPPTHPEDKGLDLSAKVFPILAVSVDEVSNLFARYGLLDDQVKFLKGWFKDTLAPAPIEKLAVLRLDGDLYESTMDALGPLYGKVSPGGFVIVDDYFSCPPCKRAIDEFREVNKIDEKLSVIDGHSVFWRKRKDA